MNIQYLFINSHWWIILFQKLFFFLQSLFFTKVSNIKCSICSKSNETKEKVYILWSLKKKWFQVIFWKMNEYCAKDILNMLCKMTVFRKLKNINQLLYKLVYKQKSLESSIKIGHNFLDKRAQYWMTPFSHYFT